MKKNEKKNERKNITLRAHTIVAVLYTPLSACNMNIGILIALMRAYVKNMQKFSYSMALYKSKSVRISIIKR